MQVVSTVPREGKLNTHRIRGNRQRIRFYNSFSVLHRETAQLLADKRYTEFPYKQEEGYGLQPLEYSSPYTSVRAVVLHIPDYAAKLLYAAGQAILRQLPEEFHRQLYVNPMETYHVTVFHFGRPEAPRPLRSQEEVHAARKAALSTAQGHFPIRLQPYEFALSPQGALLILFNDNPDESVDRLRDAYLNAYPDAPSITFGIIHTTLWRTFVTDRPFSASELHNLKNACSMELQNVMRNLPPEGILIENLWYVVERWHATIEGEREIWSTRKPDDVTVDKILHQFALPPRHPPQD